MIMNAAGTCKTLEEVVDLCRVADINAIVVGSITWESRDGVRGGNWWPEKGLNNLGLPNRGRGYYIWALPEMAKLAHAAGKKLGVSVVGFSPKEWADLAYLVEDSGADFIELNFSCPNTNERMLSFAPGAATYVLSKVKVNIKTGVKLTPYPDPYFLATMSHVVMSSNIEFVTTSNSFPNSGLNGAGLGGFALQQIALGQVRQFRELLPQVFQVWGVGGISSGQDLRDMREAGASAIQIGSAFLREGPGVFARVLAEEAS